MTVIMAGRLCAGLVVVTSKLNSTSPFLGGGVEQNNQLYLGKGHTIRRKMPSPQQQWGEKKKGLRVVVYLDVSIRLNKVI